MNFLQNGGADTPVLVAIAFYFVGLFYLSFRSFKKSKTFSDFILGGRNLNAVTGAMNVGAADMSSWLLMGLPGMFYILGLNQIWIVFGLILSSYASWKILAPRLRKYSEIAGNSLTIASFLQNRFNDKSGILSGITTIIILFFSTFYIASGFAASAKLLAAILHISYLNSLIISCLVIISYASIGGFLAVSWVNLLQGGLMLFALLITPIVAICTSDFSLSHFFRTVYHQVPAYFNPLRNLTFSATLGILSWGLGYFGQPHVISKYMAIKDVKQINLARKICICWMAVAMIAAAICGLLGFAYFYKIPQAETIFVAMSFAIFHPFLVGILVAVIMVAIMTTLNSQIIVCCGLLSENFYHRFIRKNASSPEMLLVTRLGLVVIAAIAFAMAYDSSSNVLRLVSHAWAGLGAAIGPVILFALFWQKTTKKAAITGIVSGALGAIIFSEIHLFPYEIFPAFLLSSLLILVVSLLDKKQIPASVVDDFVKLKSQLAINSCRSQ